MKHQLILAAGLAALAACNKGPEIHERNASVADVAKAAQEAGVGSSAIMRAGHWELKTSIDDMSIPGVPASAQMKGVMGKGVSVGMCMTEEDVKRPGGKVLVGKESPDCTFKRYDMAGGKLDAVMQCNLKPSGTSTTTMSASFSPDSFTNHVTSETTGPRGTTTMKMSMEGRRTGECTGDELTAKAHAGK